MRQLVVIVQTHVHVVTHMTRYGYYRIPKHSINTLVMTRQGQKRVATMLKVRDATKQKAVNTLAITVVMSVTANGCFALLMSGVVLR